MQSQEKNSHAIHRAKTLASKFYTDDEIWEKSKELIFTQSWQFSGDTDLMFKGDHNLYPSWQLEHYLNEPILFSKIDDKIMCLSNVCTHRGFVMHEHPTKARKIICKYHGRQFAQDGQFLSMPEFKEAEEFPTPCDNLPVVPSKNWRQFIFTSMGGSDADFNTIIERLESRLYFLDIENFQRDTSLDKTYNVHAHWALYCENYLEGFHIPFVHENLNALIDYGKYTTECYDQIVLQIGYSDGSGYCFDFPEGHPDYGKHVTAYYYWVYPNLMLNFYPWGVQLNIVKPMRPDFCKVDFLYYITNRKIFEDMQGDKLAEKTEREDEFVVESVQKGIKSRLYNQGRLSPKREKGVFYFHEMIRSRLQIEEL